MINSVVSINIVVLNGEKYIRSCLESVQRQSHYHGDIEINILDNGSTDGTIARIKNYELRITNGGFSKFNFIESDKNWGMWGGQEELLSQSAGKYVVFLSADVILDDDFIAHAIRIMNANSKLGALQAKVFQFSLSSIGYSLTTTIDTCGFKIFRSRRVVNIGHGEEDKGQFDKPMDIFGIEGAVPVFRKEALESIRVLGEIADHDLFWYAEDLDVAWRLRLAGWEQRYEPVMVAWHDRGTTKSHTQGSWLQYIRRVGTRQQISIQKRRLEWRNSRWTRIKNDYIINILKDLPYIVWREIEVLGYIILFEPGVLKEIPQFIWGIPRMLRKRKEIMKHAQVSPSQIHSYFN